MPSIYKVGLHPVHKSNAQRFRSRKQSQASPRAACEEPFLIHTMGLTLQFLSRRDIRAKCMPKSAVAPVENAANGNLGHASLTRPQPPFHQFFHSHQTGTG